MDPNATLSRIADLLRQSAYDGDAGLELDFACQDLFDWIARGGFEPEWDKHPSATGYYRCREVYHKRGERVTEERE